MGNEKWVYSIILALIHVGCVSYMLRPGKINKKNLSGELPIVFYIVLFVHCVVNYMVAGWSYKMYIEWSGAMLLMGFFAARRQEKRNVWSGIECFARMLLADTLRVMVEIVIVGFVYHYQILKVISAMEQLEAEFVFCQIVLEFPVAYIVRLIWENAEKINDRKRKMASIILALLFLLAGNLSMWSSITVAFTGVICFIVLIVFEIGIKEEKTSKN